MSENHRRKLSKACVVVCVGLALSVVLGCDDTTGPGEIQGVQTVVLDPEYSVNFPAAGAWQPIRDVHAMGNDWPAPAVACVDTVAQIRAFTSDLEEEWVVSLDEPLSKVVRLRGGDYGIEWMGVTGGRLLYGRHEGSRADEYGQELLRSLFGGIPDGVDGTVWVKDIAEDSGVLWIRASFGYHEKVLCLYAGLQENKAWLIDRWNLHLAPGNIAYVWAMRAGPWQRLFWIVNSSDGKVSPRIEARATDGEMIQSVRLRDLSSRPSKIAVLDLDRVLVGYESNIVELYSLNAGFIAFVELQGLEQLHALVRRGSRLFAVGNSSEHDPTVGTLLSYSIDPLK